MAAAPKYMGKWSGSETDRLALLRHYDISPRGLETLDQITDFAAALCECPIALVSIVEERRQFFVAATGLDARETARELSFCAHAMLRDEIMVVPDASRDPRFADNGLVTGAPNIRFYAGAPLINADGLPLGSLCVIDDRPHAGLTALQRQGLTMMAHQVMDRLEARRRSRDDKLDIERAALAVSDSEQRFRILADTMPQMVWSTRPDGYHDYYNARWYEFTGVSAGSTDGTEWNGTFHPDDQERAWTRWRHSLDSGEAYEIEYRLRHHSGEYRWTLGRALPIRDADGAITRWFGTCTDIHEQKRHLEERELIAHELSHRIKNIFSVIAGLIGFSGRGRPDIAPVAEELRARVMALGRAHDYVRPHSANSASPIGHTSLKGMLDELFAPYRLGETTRIAVDGEDIAFDDRSATPLALVFHELATNAAKYGALSTADGDVTVLLETRGDDCIITWRELGGPAIIPATAAGFGSQLIGLSIERQLGGRISRAWRPEGLEVTIAVPSNAMRRESA